MKPELINYAKINTAHYAIKHNTHTSSNVTPAQIKQLWQNPNSLSMNKGS